MTMKDQYLDSIRNAVPSVVPTSVSQSDDAGYEEQNSAEPTEGSASGLDQPGPSTSEPSPSEPSPTASSPSGTSTTAEPADSETVEEESAEAGETGYELPLDQLFEILKNSRRRETIRYLHENGGDATLSDLAEHIAAIENDTTIRAISSSQRKRVYVGLYQCHLPKMDDTDVVDFNQNRGTIELGPNADQLDAYLEEPEPQTFHTLYIGVAFLGTVLFMTSQVALTTVSPSIVLLAILAGVFATALYERHHRRA